MKAICGRGRRKFEGKSMASSDGDEEVANSGACAILVRV